MKNNTAGTRPWHNMSDWLTWWLSEPRLDDANQRILDGYYRKYKNNHNDHLLYHYASQTKEITEKIMPGTRVLEIGCGCGTESLWFALLGGSILGLDINSERLKVANARKQLIENKFRIKIDVQFHKQNIFDLTMQRAFDIVWMEQALHHIEPRDKLPSKLASLIKPGGYIIITETNGWNPFIQMMFFKQRGIKTIKEYTDDTGEQYIYGNERITSARNVSKIFSKSNFKTISTRHYRVLPNTILTDKLVWIEKLVHKSLRPAFTHYNIVLQKTF